METKPISNTKLIILIIIFLIIIIILWSRFISTSGLKVKEYPIYSENISDNFDGFKIVHFSDLLYGRTVDQKDVDLLVKKINELKPDIVVFTGNLIDKDTINNEKITKSITNKLSNIDAKFGKFAIYGNQDYKLENYEVLMKNAGFTILNNSTDLIYYDSSIPIFIAGFPSSLKGKLDVDNTLSYINENKDDIYYKIALIHEGDTIDKIKDYDIDLVLSGHSLNGQVRIPFVGAIYTPNGSKKYYDNYYKLDKTDVYISSGIGTTNYSFRWFNKPSINFYRLYKK